jgi:hypothetical protein
LCIFICFFLDTLYRVFFLQDAMKRTLKRPMTDSEMHAVAVLLDKDKDGKVSVRTLLEQAEARKDKGSDVEALEAQVIASKSPAPASGSGSGSSTDTGNGQQQR